MDAMLTSAIPYSWRLDELTRDENVSYWNEVTFEE